MTFPCSRSNACDLLRLGGAILLSTGSQGSGVDLMVPVMIRIVMFNWRSIFWVCVLFSHTGAPYSATGYTVPSAVARSTSADKLLDRLLT